MQPPDAPPLTGPPPADLLEIVFANAGAGLCLLDPQGRVLKVNAQWLALSRLRLDEVLGREFWGLFPQTPAELRRRHEEACKSGLRELPLHSVQRDDGEAWFEGHLTPVPMPGGVGQLHTVTEITERRRAEQARQHALDELSSIVHASPIPIVALDNEGHVILWNSATERVFGWKAAEVLGQPVGLVPPERQDEFVQMRRKNRAGESHRGQVTERLARDGRRVPVSMSTAPLRSPGGEVQGMVAAMIDLTEQATLREALSESERRFTMVFDESPVAKLLVRVSDRKVVEINRAGLDMLGLSREDIAEKVSHGQPLGLSTEARASLWDTLDRQGHVTDFELKFCRSNGTEGDAIISARRLTLTGVDYALVVVQDVTERRGAERALRESDARFRQIADTIEEVFWLTDPTGEQIIYVSPGYERIWGRSCQSVHENPRSWLDAIHPDDRGRVTEAARARLAAGTYDEEYRIVRADGETRWVRDRAFPVRDASGQVVRIAGSAQDITARRQLEAQFRQTQKMESIGQLAGGVAHDFNNLLTVIEGGCEALREQLVPGSEGASLLDEIQEASGRAATLTQQLLAFSRREVVEPRVITLDAIVTGTEKMLRRLLGEDIQLEILPDRAPAPVKVDPGSWTQVVMNLAVNARDAMPRGGKLTLEVGHVVLGEYFVKTRPPLRAGRHAVLVVSDTGQGMTTEVQARIFEPFFTTKGEGKGTGLGLSVVHGIITQSGGYIEVASHPGQGTTFRLYVPTADSVPPPAKAGHGGDPGPGSGAETVLVVEDEDGIRRVVTRALATAGYRVLQARDGVQALEVARDHQGTIDLLLTDVVMPRMDGRTLAETLVAQRPKMRVLYTSGYTDDAVLRYGVQHAEVAFLTKPYTIQALRQRVRELLDTNDAKTPKPR